MNNKHNKKNSLITFINIIFLMNLNYAQAVDETIPHPIDERGLMSQIAVKTTKLFRPVEIVEIRNGVLQTPELTIAPGTVVVIDNKDKTNHRMMYAPGPNNELVDNFTSTVIKPDDLWGAEFVDPGVYPYRCTLHQEKEHGVVRVVEVNE
jgi:plastocyanin